MRRMLPSPTLRTERLVLRPVRNDDAAALFAMHGDPYVLRFWDSPPWQDASRAAAFLAASRRLEDEGTGARLVVERRTDGAFLGWCGLTGWNPGYRSASLGFCFVEESWGRGHAAEAGRALLAWGYDALPLNRVQAECDTRNAACARVLEKLGFVREGTLREDCVVDGVVSDSWVYGLLRRDWQAHPRGAAAP